MSDKKTFTLDDGTMASNPGNVAVNPLVWVRHRVGTVALLLSWTLGCLAGAYVYSWWLLVAVGLGLAASIFYWTRVKEHFAFGDSNGGIVISVDPPLVAVSTDLTKFGGRYPVIKIIPYGTDSNIHVGDRVGTVALYCDEYPATKHWADFSPIPIDYATSDKLTIANVLESYPDEQWEAIERGLGELERPYAPGLYKVERDGSDW